MSKAVSSFISGLVVIFGEPKFDVPDHDKPNTHREWLKKMVHNLGGFSPETLRRAEDMIVSKRKFRNFPLPSECLEACVEADKNLKAERPRLIGTETAGRGATNEERERLAMELILGPLGRQAAREGWIHSLFTWTRDHMRLPTEDSDIRWCMSAAKGFDREFDRCRAADPFSIQGKLVPLGTSMLQKREALARYVETGVMP